MRALRALVVDDSQFARKLLRVALQNAVLAQWTFQDAQTGLEAIRFLKEFEYDLVVSDVNMPELSGLGLLRYIRRTPQLERLPVIIVSSVGSGLALPSLVEQGATTVLAKPITTPSSITRLAEAIAEVLR